MKRRYQNPPQLKNGNDGLWFFQEKGGGGVNGRDAWCHTMFSE